MGRKKRSAPSNHANPTNPHAAANGHHYNQPPPSKKPAVESQESYAVKKYRITSSNPHTYKAIDAFQKYTKTHRMSDASFARVQPPGRGATIAAPIVFSIRMGGSSLSWGRGKTRDIAIDNACRAAFGLVAAHGYHQFDLNDDCLTVEPMEILNATLPPPPPPPPAMGMMGGMGAAYGGGYGGVPGLPPPPNIGSVPLPPGVPPLPLPPMAGGAPPLPPGGPPPNVMMDLIPQPKVQDGTLAQSSHVTVVGGGSIMNSTTANGSVGASVSLKPSATATSASGSAPTRTKLKGGLTLVFQAETEEGMMTMEQLRAKNVRYKGALEKALALRTIALA